MNRNRNSPSSSAKVSESHCFFWRQVDDDEPIDARFSRILDHSFLSVDQYGIVVSHEQHWHFQPSFSCCSNHFQGRGDGNIVVECNLDVRKSISSSSNIKDAMTTRDLHRTNGAARRYHHRASDEDCHHCHHKNDGNELHPPLRLRCSSAEPPSS